MQFNSVIFQLLITENMFHRILHSDSWHIG